MREGEATPDTALFVDYSNLPDALPDFIFPHHFGMEQEMDQVGGLFVCLALRAEGGLGSFTGSARALDVHACCSLLGVSMIVSAGSCALPSRARLPRTFGRCLTGARVLLVPPLLLLRCGVLLGHCSRVSWRWSCFQRLCRSAAVVLCWGSSMRHPYPAFSTAGDLDALFFCSCFESRA